VNVPMPSEEERAELKAIDAKLDKLFRIERSNDADA